MSTPNQIRLEDLNRATEVNEHVSATLDDQYQYHAWNDDKIRRGGHVRDALKLAASIIIQHVPPCPDRSTALRKLREARMDCNSAITHDGRY